MSLLRTLCPTILALVALALPGQGSAQSSADWKYQVGIRSTFMLTEMPLSQLGGGFADLPAGGKSMPHASSLFVLWPLGTHWRVGVETLVGNSFAERDTEMLFQASGVTAEYQTAGTWFVAASVQTGGMIASATQSGSETEGEPLRAGAHFKDSGVFVAPQLGLGRRVRQYDIRLIAKRVLHFRTPRLDAFDSFYAGISVGLSR